MRSTLQMREIIDMPSWYETLAMPSKQATSASSSSRINPRVHRRLHPHQQLVSSSHSRRFSSAGTSGVLPLSRTDKNAQKDLRDSTQM